MFFRWVFRFVQICLDWSRIFGISAVLFRFSLVESRLVRIPVPPFGLGGADVVAWLLVAFLDARQAEQEEA